MGRTDLVRLYITLELGDGSVRTDPKLLRWLSLATQVARLQVRAHLFGDGRDEPFVVGDQNDATVPTVERTHERVETL